MAPRPIRSILVVVLGASAALGQVPGAGEVREAEKKGVEFLRKAQDASGAWTVTIGQKREPQTGLTGLVLLAILGGPERPAADDAQVRKAIEFLKKQVREDGSISAGQLLNYETSAALQGLAAAGDQELKPLIEKARDFLLKHQADEGEKYTPKDRYYGGAGYGASGRVPDMSNLALWAEGLRAAGVPKGHESFKKALRFLERCQNHSETNQERVEDAQKRVVVSGNDGGGVYAVGDSKAGFDPGPEGTVVARSYGSMTYALFKGYVYGGLGQDDPRVKAALQWLSSHWTLDENPGFDKERDPDAGKQGLFYYYWTMAQALDAAGVDAVTTPEGETHSWRPALAQKLLSLQRPDGSWKNDKDRWYEATPELATAYALQALSRCRKGLK
jgi:squalene-hopene/tetraprenyl-beta-curcumene cyclase